MDGADVRSGPADECHARSFSIPRERGLMDTFKSLEEQSAVAIFGSREEPVAPLTFSSGCLGRDATVGKWSIGCCGRWQPALDGCLRRIVFRWSYRAKCGSGSSTLAPPSWRQAARLEHLYAWPVA